MTQDFNPEELRQAVAAVDPEATELNGFQSKKDREIAAKLIPQLTFRIANQIRTKLEVENTQKLQQKIDALVDENRKMIEAEVAKLREASKPPDAASLQKLLDQEYLEFTVTIPGGRSSARREFVIRELPLEAEKKLIRTIEKKVVPLLKNIGKTDFSGSTEERLQKIMDALPDGLQTFAELAALCLNPWGEDEQIDALWVQQNLSSYRILNILLAQIEAGRLRDFFLGIYRVIPGTITV